MLDTDVVVPMRVVLTGVTISGKDIVDTFQREHHYVTIAQVIADLPLRLTDEQRRILTTEAVQVLTALRNSCVETSGSCGRCTDSPCKSKALSCNC